MSSAEVKWGHIRSLDVCWSQEATMGHRRSAEVI